MSKHAAPIVLSVEEEKSLQQWVRAGTSEQRLADRVRAILLAHQGRTNREIAKALRTRPARISKWRRRFARDRWDGLKDGFRSGRPRRYDAVTERRILKQLDEPPSSGYAHWSGGLVAEALGDVSADQVWRVLRKYDIALQRRRSWCVSTDPEFARKAADVVGLYLNPPQEALVLAVDEKPHIQALERAQGWLRLPNGKALNGYSHCYKRHGTTTLFAALDVATGLVQAGHYQRRRRREFLDFMNEIVAAHVEQDIHVILDNLSTHKPKQDRWLRRHPRVHFHFIPTYSSWLNQVECWFSILSRQALRGASFTSPQQLRQAIDRFIEAHNQKAAPFEWRKKEVHPVGLKRKYADLCK